jgi:exonuclease VII large subunit
MTTPTKAAAYVLRCEKTWLQLLADGKDKLAASWSPVLTAMQDNDPELACEIARRSNLEPRVIATIRQMFDLD